jgi:hypothetical protein
MRSRVLAAPCGKAGASRGADAFPGNDQCECLCVVSTTEVGGVVEYCSWSIAMAQDQDVDHGKEEFKCTTKSRSNQGSILYLLSLLSLLVIFPVLT